MPPYANKDAIATYLAELKDEGKLGNLQYCLFQPSIFMDYFAHPYPLAPELITWPFFVDFEHRRAILLDDGNQPLVLTAITDDSAILARALEDSCPWPTIGGIRGARTSINELIALGRKIRGGDWSIEKVSSEEIARGELNTSWVPVMSHPVIPTESREEFSKAFVIMFFQGISNQSWDVSAEWNERFPEYGFADLEAYLREAWEGKL